jgi:hypothetical protein
MPFGEGHACNYAASATPTVTEEAPIVQEVNCGNRATDPLLTLRYDDGKQKYEMQRTIRTGSNGYLAAPDTLHICTPSAHRRMVPVSPIGRCTFNLPQIWTVNGYTVKSDNPALTCAASDRERPLHSTFYQYSDLLLDENKR